MTAAADMDRDENFTPVDPEEFECLRNAALEMLTKDCTMHSIHKKK